MRFVMSALVCTAIVTSCGWSSLSEAATASEAATTSEAATANEPAAETPALSEKQGSAPELLNTPDEAQDVSAEPVSGTDVSETTTTSSTTTTTAAPRLFYDMLAPAGTRSQWSGTIGNGDDPRQIDLWLAEKDGFIIGEITFADNGTPRTLAGTRLDEGIFFHEFARDGRVLRSYTSSSLSNGVFDGLVAGNAAVNIILDAIVEDDEVFSGGVSAGSYRNAFGPFEGENVGPIGLVTLSDVTAESATLEISSVTGAPAHNLAVIAPTEVPIFGNSARYEERSDWLDCGFDVVAFGDVVFVEHFADRWECGFGNNASVEGVYVRTT